MFSKRSQKQSRPVEAEPSEPDYRELGARVEHILRLAEKEAENIREEARRAASQVLPDAEQLYVLLTTENGQIRLVSARIYADLQQARDLAAEYQESAGTSRNIRYSIGVIVPLNKIG